MSKRERIAVALLVFAAIVFRVWATSMARFTEDEALSWLTARGVATFDAFPAFGPPITGTDARTPGPFFYYFMAIPQLLGASPYFGAIFTAILHGLLGLIVFDVARRARSVRAGFIALALFVFAPWDVLYGDRIWSANIVPVLATMAIYAAIRSETSALFQSILVFTAVIFAQVHLTAPVVWIFCIVVLYFRRPKVIARETIAWSAILALALYARPLSADLRNELANTIAIFAKSGGSEEWSYRATIPVRMVTQLILFGSSELGYHFERGYWGGRFDELATYFTPGGWSLSFASAGVLLGIANLISIALALAAFITTLVIGFPKIIQLIRRRERTEAELEHVLLLGLIASVVASAVLLMLSGKIFFPHYLNFLMPLALVPIALGIDTMVARKRVRGAVAVALWVSITAMGVNTVRYYLSVDSLNGLAATLEMTRAAIDERRPVSLSFEDHDNTYAWRTLANHFYRAPLDLENRTQVRLRVHNKPPKDRAIDLLQRSEAMWTAVNRWGEGIVTVDPPIETYETGRPENGFVRYGDQPWQKFGAEAFEIAGTSEQLVHLHPIEGRVVRVAFPVPSAARFAILRYGLADKAMRSRNEAPVDVRVMIGGIERAHVEARKVPGLARVELPIEAASGTLEIEIRTQRDGARIFGFDLELYAE